MSISTILLAVAVVVEFIATAGMMKLYKEAVEQNEQSVRENAELGSALLNANRQISKLHKRNRRSVKHGNIAIKQNLNGK